MQRTDVVVEYQVPSDADLDAALQTADDLIDRGDAATALRYVKDLDVSRSALAVPYEFLRTERLGRSAIAVGDSYFLKGNRDEALWSYNEVWAELGLHPLVRAVAAAARDAIEFVLAEHRRLVDLLAESAARRSFDHWCDDQERLRNLNVLAVSPLRDRITMDADILTGLEAHPHVQVLDRPRALPGSIFRLAHGARDDLGLALRLEDGAESRVPAELAMPLISALATARSRQLAVAHGLTLAGDAVDAIPIFRYTYLRDKTNELIAQIEQLDARAYSVETRLDDLQAVFVRLERAQSVVAARVEALKREKVERQKQLTAMKELALQAQAQAAALRNAAEQCESDWYLWALGAGGLIALPALGVGLAFTPDSQATFAWATEMGAGVLALVAGSEAISCDNVHDELAKRERAAGEIGAAMDRTKNELAHVEARIQDELVQIERIRSEHAQEQHQDIARILSTPTLGAIRSQLTQVRGTLVTQVVATAALAQTAFNFEHDANLQVIRDAYCDPARKGYGAGETLKRDLETLDHFRLTTHKNKRQQLSHTISLRRHHTMAFVGFKATGRATFSTDMAAFDRAFPGTFLQRTKEVRVDVLVDEQPVVARGYVSNAGISSVRLPEYNARRVMHHSDVSADPDPDVAKLCYMRLVRRQPPETAAFCAFESPLFTRRLLEAQGQERNFFENLGVETAWHLELLPEQDFALAAVTDVRLHIQYEAQFDEMLKRVLEDKRYVKRRESLMRSIRQLAEDQQTAGSFFSTAASFQLRRDLLEAPHLEKHIVDVGFVVRARKRFPLGGPAMLRIAVDGGPALALTTDNTGIVATASDHPTGVGVAALAAAARGKSVHIPWAVQIDDLPAGLGATDLEDVLFLLQYEYAATP